MLQSEDISVAYARVAARLLGPKPYAVSAQAEVVVLKPGFLQVDVGDSQPPAETAYSQLIILDASGSMLKRLGGKRRIDVAKAALSDYLSSQVARSQAGEKLAVGLRIFGGKPNSCDTELVQPVSPFNNATLTTAVNSVRPQNNAKTPIGAALLAAATDFEKASSSASILLITDGEETCGGNPGLAIKHLRTLGISARIDVVSYALEPEIDRRPFESWAKAGGGIYVDAATGEDLQAALVKTSRARFSVLKNGELIATGTSGESAIELESGTYELQFEGLESQKFSITSSKTTRIVKN